MFTFSPLLKKHYNSWDELEKVIETLSTATEKGLIFEQFCYAFFKIKSNYYQVQEVYPSRYIPQNIKSNYFIANRDSGIDGIIVRTDGKVVAYQSKFRSHRVKPTYAELTKFWSESRYCDYSCTIANSYSLSELSDKHEKNLNVLVNDFIILDTAFFNELFEFTNKQNLADKKYYCPFDYQERIISDVISKFQFEDRGKIIAACGTGKTLTALWITEKMNCNNVLFLAPSIALIKQTLESWTNQAKNSFQYLCVCSDSTVVDEIGDDYLDINISDLGIPVTTNENDINDFLVKNKDYRKYIFSTYQSTDKIVDAIKDTDVFFDLTIFDEAHRTAGLRSSFNLALEDRNIRSKKRLFMTATEKLVLPLLKRRAENNGKVIFSMDDESIYGPLFSRYNFGEAIKDETISDYKIIVAGVKEKDIYEYIKNNTSLSVEDMGNEEKLMTAQSLYSKVLLAKSMQNFSIRKVISFHSTVQRAKLFSSRESSEIPLEGIIKDFNNNLASETIYIDHINGSFSSGERTKILETFKKTDFSVISNARCLTEGVDVPIIDSVYFVDRKSSLIDIVQACGRALRTEKGVKKTAYFIIPILYPEENIGKEIFNMEEFETVFNVIQSLRDQDNRLAEWIDGLNRNLVRGGKSVDVTDPPIFLSFEDVDIKEFSEELYLRIATINKDPLRLISEPVTYDKGERKTSQTRKLKPICDYNYKSLIKSLVNPTLDVFIDNNKYTLHKDDIFLNHNNVSHTKKLGLIEKIDREHYTLTPLGKELINNKITIEDLFKRQVLRYSCSFESGNDEKVFFPYRAIFKIIMKLEKREINFFEFAFCIYPMFDSSLNSVIQALYDINYLRLNYPGIDLVSIINRENILSELNQYYKTQISVTDIWGGRPTTIKNQFYYFKNHFSQFEEIIETDGKVIRMLPGSDDKLNELLEKDEVLETENKITLWDKYSSVFNLLIFFLFS